MSASNRPGRRKKELVDDGTPVAGFAASLRALREDAGTPSYRQMSKRGNVAHNVLSQADSGHRMPTEEAVVAYARACGGDIEEWKERRRRALIAHQAVEEAFNPHTRVGQREQSVPVTNDQPDPSPGPTPATEENEAKTAPDPARAEELTGKGGPIRFRRRWIAYIAAGLVVSVVAGITVRQWTDSRQDPEQPGVNAALPSAPSEETRVMDTDTADAQQERVCRRDWEEVAVALSEFRPCITPHPDGLALSAQVRLVEPDTDPVQVTVWLWLMDLDPRLLARAQYDHTRDEATLRSCRLSLSEDQVQECAPELVVPPRPGRYSTSGSIRFHESTHPPGWDNPDFAGTQSQAVTWPVEPGVEQAQSD